MRLHNIVIIIDLLQKVFCTEIENSKKISERQDLI